MNILISGCTCSGKTTLAKEIVNSHSYGKVSHIEEDWYYKDLKDIPRSRLGYLMESPNAFYTEEFIKDIDIFLSGEALLFPEYEISNNRRLSKNKIIKYSDINVIEGLHTIDLLRNLNDSIKVFFNTSLSECLKRRIERDKKYGIPEDVVIRHFNDVIVPLYKSYILQSKDIADVIIESEEDKVCLLKKLKKL